MLFYLKLGCRNVGSKRVFAERRWGMAAILALELVVTKPLVSYFSTKENYLILSFSPLL